MTQAFNLSQFANFVNNSGQADLTTAVVGTLPVANGGTGLTTPGAAGNVLTSDGSVWISSTSGSGSVADGTMYENNLVITNNYTLTAGKNAMSVGPITIDPGVSVTVPTDQRWIIL
jgi:hypothetical protein